MYMHMCTYSMLVCMCTYSMLVFGDGRHIKLCDFGTARDLSVTVDMTKSIGTIRYMAPEMLRGGFITGHYYHCN